MKKILSLLLTVALTLTVLFAFGLSASADVTADGNIYAVSDGAAWLSKWTGSGEAVIPATVNDGTNDLPVTAVGASAFAGNAGVTSVTLPASVTKIETGAFNGCSALTTVSGEGVTEIGENAFTGCKNLANISLPAAQILKAKAFSGCSSLAQIALPAVTEVWANAFEGCSTLNSVDLPAVISIGDGAFKGCSALTSLSVGANCTTWGSDVLTDCTALTTLRFDSVKAPAGLNKYAVQNLTALTQILVPAGCAQAYKNAFARTTSITKKIVEDGATGSVLSQGTVWIIVAVAVLAVAALIVLILLKKKKPAKAED